MKIFSIKDLKVGFNDPFVAPNEGAAVRSFGESCKHQESAANKFPEDYELWVIGTWTPLTGEIDKLEEPQCIAKATQYVVKEEKTEK